MAMQTVNPTRMELTRLKLRLKTARRGHKLLKDKRDELMRRFLEQVSRTRTLRREVEQGMRQAQAAMDMAAARLSPHVAACALLCPGGTVHLRVDMRSRMGVSVPEFVIAAEEGEGYPYGLAQTDGALDDGFRRMQRLLPGILELAGAEKAVHLMARELETTRRRVNALEYTMIPQLEETIRRISMKLEENERGNLVRLMKVKDLVLEDARAHRKIRDA